MGVELGGRCGGWGCGHGVEKAGGPGKCESRQCAGLEGQGCSAHLQSCLQAGARGPLQTVPVTSSAGLSDHRLSGGSSAKAWRTPFSLPAHILICLCSFLAPSSRRELRPTQGEERGAQTQGTPESAGAKILRILMQYLKSRN